MAKEMLLVQMLVFSLFNMKEKIEEMEMDSFYRFVHKGQHYLLIAGEEKYKLVFRGWQKTFWMQNS